MSAPEPHGPAAPPLSVSHWFNTDVALSLAQLRGRVVLLHAFQMLCPACVSHGLPQAVKVHRAFPRSEVVVVGLHSVFEHHEAMAPHALQAFLGEYRIPFPVAVDLPSPRGPIADPVPTTLQAYGLRGTPSLLLIDQRGIIRLQHFGLIEDLQLGVMLGRLVAELAPRQEETSRSSASDGGNDGAPGAVDGSGCTPLQCPVIR